MSDFADLLFPTYFSAYDKKVDTYKDENGYGITERFNQGIGADIDDNLSPYIDNLFANVFMPSTCLEQYVPFLESEIGYDNVNNNLRLSQDMTFRRACIKFSKQMANIRGTLRCYQVLFGKLGCTVVMTEGPAGGTFDDGVPFDTPTRHFDTQCQSCSGYALAVTGTAPYSTTLTAAFASIIAYNQPINAVLTSFTYNGASQPTLFGDFNSDYNDDYYT